MTGFIFIYITLFTLKKRKSTSYFFLLFNMHTGSMLDNSKTTGKKQTEANDTTSPDFTQTNCMILGSDFSTMMSIIASILQSRYRSALHSSKGLDLHGEDPRTNGEVYHHIGKKLVLMAKPRKKGRTKTWLSRNQIWNIKMWNPP